MKNLLFYSAGSLGLNLLSLFVMAKFLFFFDDRSGSPILPMLWASLALVLGRVLDALIDPMIGMISDHLKFRWGRRKGLMLLALPLMLLGFFLIWHPPAFRGDVSLFSNFLHALLFINLFFISFALYGIPYDAYLAEISFHEETKLRASNLKALFALLALVLGTTVLGMKDIRLASVLLLLMAAVPLLFAFLGMPEKPIDLHSPKFKLSKTQLSRLPQSFWILMLSVFFMEAASNFFFKSIDYFDLHLLGEVPSHLIASDLRHTLLYLSFAVSMVVGLFVWEKMAKRLSHQLLIGRVLLWGSFVFPWGLGVGFLPGESRTFAAFIYFAAIGFFYAALALLIVARVASISQGYGKESGIFFGIYAFVKKTGFALAVGIFAVYLEVLHYFKIEEVAYHYMGFLMAGLTLIAYFIFGKIRKWSEAGPK
jgi:Na+/melibiose symporter-like transporter